MPLILILNGPNLNMLGMREPDIYGSQTLADIHELCLVAARKYGLQIDFRQSNHEGELVTWIQGALSADAVIINAAAYTHTSVAIHDALKLLKCPIAEVHLSNPRERESFRHVSLVESVAKAHFAGHGAQGYVMAIDTLAGLLGIEPA